MRDVRIVEVDQALHAQTDMRAGTRMVRVAVPTDRPVRVHAVVNAKRLQQCRIWDAAGRMHFEWEGVASSAPSVRARAPSSTRHSTSGALRC